MRNHQMRTLERSLPVQICQLVPFTSQLRERLLKISYHLRTAIAHEVLAAPAVFRLEDPHGMSARQQLGRDASQEVRISVVPVRNQRMVEQSDSKLQAAASSSERSINSP